MHLLYSLQFLLSGRGMRFFPEIVLQWLLCTQSRSACIHTDDALSGGEGVGIRWKPLSMRVLIASCESLHSCGDVLLRALHGSVSRTAFAEKWRHLLNRHISDTVEDNIMNSLCILPLGSRITWAHSFTPWAMREVPSHWTWRITGWSKWDGSEVFQMEHRHGFPFLTGMYQGGEKSEDETFGHLVYEELLKLSLSH